MEPPARSHGARSSTTGTVTVAELLARYTGVAAPAAPPPEPVGAVSVAALLRREGRGPHVADRPLQPRGHTRVSAPPAGPPRRSVRKAAVAAGALFAATAVLGPSVIEDSANRAPSEPGTGIPLPLAGTPRHAAADDAALLNSAAREDLVMAAMRQLFADSIPSDVDGTALEGTTARTASTGRHAAVRRLSTPGRASNGSADPAVAPSPGTLPPGGAGTPPGGTWSWPYAPAGSPGYTPSGPGAAAAGGQSAGADPGAGASGGGPGSGPSAEEPGGHGNGANGGGAPGRVDVALSPPAMTTPAVHVPSARAELPGVGPVHTPAVTVGQGVVAAPAVRAAVGPQKLEVVSTPAEIGVPDLGVSGARVGPVASSAATVTTPDVEISGARVALSSDAPPELALPGVRVSATKIDPPDVALGRATVTLPDVELPAVEVPTTALGSEITGTVGRLSSGLLGDDDPDTRTPSEAKRHEPTAAGTADTEARTEADADTSEPQISNGTRAAAERPEDSADDVTRGRAADRDGDETDEASAGRSTGNTGDGETSTDDDSDDDELGHGADNSSADNSSSGDDNGGDDNAADNSDDGSADNDDRADNDDSSADNSDDGGSSSSSDNSSSDRPQGRHSSSDTDD